MKLVVVTACLAGVAHSKMVAAALKKEGEKRGHEVYCEMQGGANLSKKLPQEICDSADVVVFAHAIKIAGKERFEGKPIIDMPIDKAIRNISKIVDEAEKIYNENSKKLS